jgi:GTPase SAR1 family protein
MSEIRKLCKKTPIILVATGIDSIDEKDNVSKEEGLMIMHKCGVDAYVECETNNKDQVAELFEDALLSVKSRKRRRSSLLHSLIHR